MIRTAMTGVCCLLVLLTLHGQPNVIRSYAMTVTDAKTTNIIFPYAIISVDRGSARLLAQQAPGVKNILQLKAADAAMPATNVSVVTADGKFYSFLVRYDAEPGVLNIAFDKQRALLQGDAICIDTLEAIANKIKQVRARMSLNVACYGVKLRLRNVFADSTGTWLSLSLRSLSYLPFQPQQMRCFIKQTKAPKRTAMQEADITPLYADALPHIGCPAPLYMSVALPAMAFGRSRRLYVQFREAPGARVITLPISWRRLAKARRLPKKIF